MQNVLLAVRTMLQWASVVMVWAGFHREQTGGMPGLYGVGSVTDSTPDFHTYSLYVHVYNLLFEYIGFKPGEISLILN